MDARDTVSTDDLSALAWVQEELRKSLETAHKSLRRFVKESDALSGSDVDAVDPSVLRQARQQLHQGAGALELVGLAAGAQLLRASEAAVQRLGAKPKKLTSAAVDTIERASFALLDYLTRRLAGKQVSTLALFPAYRSVQELAGAERVHPADLWSQDWQWRDVPEAAQGKPTQVDARTRSEFESLMLQMMRQPTQAAAAARMGDLFSALAAGASDRALRSLWQLSAAFFDGQAHGMPPPDVYTKRVGSRLLAQLRICERGGHDVSERLALDLLFFCAQAGPGADGRQTPRLAAVRRAYGLSGLTAGDYEDQRLGRFDPAVLLQARKRVAGAKDGWSGAAGGELHRLGGLAEQFTLVNDSLKRLFPAGEQLAQALHEAVHQTVASGHAPSPELAMEVATAVLYLDAALEDGEFDRPDEADRVRRLAQRVEHVRHGGASEPLEPWMEELYRRVSDRQTMGSVVQELRASLSEAEKLIDQYFRNPSARDVLIPVPGQLSAMRGVLSVLGLDHAAHAVVRMRDEVDALANTEVDPQRAAQAGTFDRLAGNLGALGFLIDLVSVQPQLAKSLFVYDAESGSLRAVMGQQAQRHADVNLAPADADARLIEQARDVALAAVHPEVTPEQVAHDLERLSEQALVHDQATLAEVASTAHGALEHAESDEARQAVREEVAQAIAHFVASTSDAVTLEPPAPPVAPAPIAIEAIAAPAPVATPPAAAPAPAAGSGLEEDEEMREIFLEEAREVIEGANEALTALADEPADIGQLTTVRRAFHTLKGSSRMVGLTDFGEAGWACEQLYNARLADAPSADEALLGFTRDALTYMADWVDAIEARAVRGHQPNAVREAADALRLEGRRAPLPLPTSLAAQVPELPSAEDLDLSLRSPELPVEPAPQAVAEPVPSAEIDETPEANEATAVLPAGDVSEEPLSFDLDLAELSEPQPVELIELHLDPEPESEQTVAVAAPLAAAPDFESEPPTIALPGTLTTDAPTLDDTPVVDEALDLTLELPELSPLDGEAPPQLDLQPEPLAEEPVLDLSALDAVAESDHQHEPEPELVIEAAPVLEPETIEAVDLPAEPAAEAESEPAGDDGAVDLDQVKVVGPLRISIPLFNIYLNEADELSRRLCTELGEWSLELHLPVSETAIAMAHSLAGNSATVGFADLSQLARALEHALMRSHAIGHGEPDEAQLFVDAAEEIRRLLHQFAAGFLKDVSPELMARLAEHEVSSAQRLQAAAEHLPVEPTDEVALLPEVQVSEEPAPEETAQPQATLPEVVSLPLVMPSAGDQADEASAPVAEAVPLPEPMAAEAEPLPVPEPLPQEPADATELMAELPADTAPASEEAPAPAAPVPELSVLSELGQPALRALDALPEGERRTVVASSHALDDEDDIDAVDAIDAELFPIFEEEGQELLPQLASQMREWASEPGDNGRAAACMRTLHTLKGGARLAGAMRLGEMAHRLETAIEHLLQRGGAQAVDVEPLELRVDALQARFDALRSNDAAAYEQAAAAVEQALREAPPVVAVVAPEALEPAVPVDRMEAEAAAGEPVEEAPSSEAAEAVAPSAPVVPGGQPLPAVIDWSRFQHTERVAPRVRTADRAGSASQASVRVRAPLLDRLVNHAGEVSITRSRIESDVAQLKSSLTDLTDNLERLRRQLRDIELQAETQIQSRIEAAKAMSQEFDPLEFDRFTRFQELTRMMAESVNDVATVQRSLQRTLQSTEDELAAQARLTRDLQDDLLRTRMVEFEGLSERLYRVVRQAAKETGKQVRLDIVGGSIEVDRGVLDRMTGAFEHLLRNCVTHGIETPEARQATGKDAAGQITVVLTQEGNEVGVEFRDDGAGLNLRRIRERGVAMGLLQPQAEPSEAELASLIFTPGFSTAETVTELAGRGIGMDVVRNEVNAMGGRIETATAAGKGTSFKLVLPLTTAVTQVVMVRCGETTVAIPSTLIEIVRRAKPQEVEQAYASGHYELGDRNLPFFWLGALLQSSPRGTETGRTLPVIIIRSAQQRIALHVDEVLGNQEVVVKNLGNQLSRLPGLAGMTLLASGAVALIYNPVALATLYGDAAWAAMREAALKPQGEEAAPVVVAEPVVQAPLVLVVDDSLTVRRVTQRLLVREGYRVSLAKDGLEGLERLAEERPAVVLSDIEMPRMDGFDLVRNMRGDQRWRDLPVIMITSRIAQKHRDYAAELGVDHYLGKPYAEEDLLALVSRYAGVAETAA